MESSVALTVNPMEGLSIGYGAGNDRPSAALDNDVTTMFATYSMGPVSVGYQVTEIDAEAAIQTSMQITMVFHLL